MNQIIKSKRFLRSTCLSSAFLFLILVSFVQAQNRDDINNRDILYLTSGGKLSPLQANLDIRHYAINLDVDMAKKSISGSTEISLDVVNKSDTLLLDLIHSSH